MANKKKRTITDILNEATQKQETSQKKELAPVNLGNIAKSVNNTIQSTTQKAANKTLNIPISPTVSTSDVTKSILGVQQNSIQNKMFNDITNNKVKQTVEAPIRTPEQIKSPVNIAKQQESIKKGREKARQEGGNTSLEGTTLNALKLFGQGMMKAEEGAFIDAPVGLISKAINTGNKLGSKVLKGINTAASILTGQSQTFGNITTDIMEKEGKDIENKLNQFVAKDLTGEALNYYGWNNKLYNGKTVEEQLESDSAIKRENIAGQVVEGLGGMAPSILMGGILGMSKAPQTTQELDKIKKLQQVVSYSSLGARSFGNGYEEAINNGATTEQATAYGLSNAAVEIGTEWLSGGIPGLKGTAGGGLDKVFEKYVLKEGLEETSKSLAKAIVKGMYKTTMEGVEEMISQTLEPFVKQFTYQYDESKGFKGNFEEAANNVHFEDVVKAGIIGSLTAVALGDVDINDIKAGYQNSQAINNVIQENITNQQQQLGRELTKEETKQIKKTVNEDVDNLSQYGEQIANIMSNVRDYNLSSEGLDLEQSYKAYNGNKKFTNQIANIQKFMNNRNINARFDATMFNDNSQNAIWTTQDGKDTVVFNPNASQDQVIQNIATHEMTHDIMAQQTETGKSLFSDVLENIKSQENYAKQRAEIEELYSKYYDKNSQDFATKVDEEMVANELGKNLGTQEYINRLVNEKPNLARRIYNWVVDKLDNIGKSAEYKEQKAYWKSVADKFEKAYNEQKTATGEDKTAYSMSEQLENQATKLTEQEIANRQTVRENILDYIADNNLENPSVKEMMGAMDDYNMIDTSNYDLEDYREAEKLYRSVAQDIYNENNTKYSLTKDSQGNNLTPQQQEYFKDSKVVDDNGNLLVMEHVSNSNFSTFKGSNVEIWENGNVRNESNGLSYFTNDKKYINSIKNLLEKGNMNNYGYGEKFKKSKTYTYNTYLNITNPLDLTTYSKEMTPREWQTLLKDKGIDLSDEEISNYSIYNMKYDTKAWNYQNTNFYQMIKNATKDFRQKLLDAGYDGIVYYDRLNESNIDKALVYVTTNPNQIKNIDNTNPTSNEDIRYSMQQEETPFTQGTRTTMGELFKNNIAPIRQDLSNITKQIDNLSKQLETMQKQANIAPTQDNTGFVETTKNNKNANQDYTAMTEKDAEIYQNALMQDEGYLKSLEAEANSNVNEKLANRLTNEFQNQLGVNKNQRAELQELMNKIINNDMSVDEIADELYKRYVWQEEKTPIEGIKEVKKAIREEKIFVDDTTKIDMGNYNDFRKDNFGKINISKYGVPVDVAYQELSSKYPGFFPNDIVNPTDQLMKIAEVANQANEMVETYQIMPEQFDSMADYIRDAILEDRYNTQVGGNEDLQKGIQFNFTEDVLPTAVRTQESIDEYIDNRDIAPVSQEQMQRNQQAPVKDRANNMIGKALQMFENRNFEIDSLAKATGNNEIKYAGDNWNNASSEANFNINNYQTDINGKWVGDSLTTIFNEMEQQGLGLVANDYLFQKSNIERHKVGKGSEVPLAVSQQLVAKYEMEHPELKKWSKKVYKLIDNYTKEQLASGLISKEKYDSYRGEYGIYGDYVPFYSAIIDKSRYFDNDGELKSVSTFKKSKGGSSDVNQLMTMKDAIANQIFRTKEAVRRNELYKEIVQQYQKYEDMLDMDMRNDPTNLDDLLFTTPEGDKVLSAYIDGKKVSAIISDELYNELSRENENRIQQMEKDFSLITKPLQKASDIRRKLVTTWNITFLARNMIKDVQDAVINSKHTADMLANYFGTKKGSKAAIFELAQAKTTEAQQFLALYGADNLYGDYSNVKSKFSLGKANELIELAPRFAEFKATLQNGGSINEAIYNAREVTVNFGRGGYITKALNRNGFTFLNANVQGLSKAIRNLTGQNGVKGVVGTVTKGMLFAIAPAILNHLLFGSGDDKDEEYEALPDYIKDNYYLIKLENGKFLRIPKGRINSVFGSGARRMLELASGDKEAFDGYLTNAWSQIGIGDLTSNNVFAPLLQAKNNKTWYGGDLVPKRLQDLPEGEQTDASIDALSNFIGENLGISPYKVNYVLDQYSGGFGDILLPMITPETTSGAETPLEYLTAPVKDAFVVNSIDDNKYAGEFYTKKEELTKKGNSMYATDEDKLRSKYMDSISSQMSELYKEKREVQADTTISNSYKYEKVQRIQNEINNLAKEGLSNYESFSKTDTYSQIGDTEYYKNNEGKWTKVNESDAEFTAGLNETEKTAYYVVKNKVSELESEYKDKVKDLSKKDKLRDKYSLEKKYNTIQAIKNSGLDNQTKAMIYGKYYSTPEKMRNVANAGYDVDTYMTALYDIEAIRDKYSKDKGYSTAYRKKKTLAYINSLNMNIPQKAMLVREYYSSFREYNNQIVNYVGNLDITREEKVSILEDMGMKVKGNRVTWK